MGVSQALFPRVLRLDISSLPSLGFMRMEAKVHSGADNQNTSQHRQCREPLVQDGDPEDRSYHRFEV